MRYFSQVLLAGLCVTTVASLPKTTAAPDDKSREPATLRELIDAAIEDTQIFLSTDSDEAAKPVVALRWANNARGDGSEDGATIIYVRAGRPLAAACFYPWAGRLSHDFEALARERVVGRRAGATIWQPQTPGVKFTEVPDAPPPDATRAQRLRQMKSLAEQFKSTMLGWKGDASDREELRLLPRPLYRYDLADGGPAEGAVIDGAVFGFVMGTDPETLLLLEAVKDGQDAEWQFAFARRTSGELDGRHRDKVVWKVERYPTENDPRQPHFSFVTPLPPQLLKGDAGGGNPQ